MKRYLRCVLWISLAMGLTACMDDKTASNEGRGLSPSAELGRLLFEDKALSASGQQACATCHDPAHDFVDPNREPVSLGGLNMDKPGFRNSPSLRYAKFIPPFHFDDESGAPIGGQFHDGRVNSLAEQATKPFTGSFEMANKDAAEVLARLKTRPYFQDFVTLFGERSVTDADFALGKIGEAIAAFESEDTAFQPFSSKFDFWVKGQAQLNEAEVRGWHVFNDPDKGNCAACHDSQAKPGRPALFTDFSYDNLGIPRNTAIVANNEDNSLDYVPNNGDDKHSYYDLGLCGPFRENLSADPALCGLFRVPTLRNVANTAPYFHNGRFDTLKATLDFYIHRDTRPEDFYPINSGGEIDKFDDLPFELRANVNTHEAPYNRQISDMPALTEAEIDDLIAFLCTLTDGYDPARPGAYTLPAQCPQTQVLAN